MFRLAKWNVNSLSFFSFLICRDRSIKAHVAIMKFCLARSIPLREEKFCASFLECFHLTRLHKFALFSVCLQIIESIYSNTKNARAKGWGLDAFIVEAPSSWKVFNLRASLFSLLRLANNIQMRFRAYETFEQHKKRWNWSQLKAQIMKILLLSFLLAVVL